MEIADYFIAKTKRISFQRYHIKSVTSDGDHLLLDYYTLTNICPHDATREERKKTIMQEFRDYGTRHVEDNRLLVSALSAIENSFTSGQFNFSLPILRELFPKGTHKLLIDNYKYRLEVLYLLYRSYRVLIWGDTHLPSECISHIKRLCGTPWDSTPHDHAMSLLNYTLTMEHDHTIESSFSIDPDTGELIEELRADTLYDALIHQLLLHIAAGTKGLDGYYLAECNSCHKPFKKRHGNTKFCPLCGRNSERVRDYKLRGKEKQHAQESNP